MTVERPSARKLALAAACLVFPASATAEPYPLFFGSPALFNRAIALAEQETRPLSAKITGVTVPHHLLAADMIASTLHLASGRKYDRIILLTPDHFRRATTACATTTRPFRTALGDVPVDAASARLLAEHQLIRESNLFSHEHGVQAVLPFIAKWFPDTPVLPLALEITSREPTWSELADLIQPLVTPDTLVIQSTDFSHYLCQPEAAIRDQESLMLLSAGDAAGIPALNQPAHIDSKAAQWIQMRLQARAFGCGTPVIVDNRNAIRYGGRPDEPRTTSYITQLFSPDFIPASALPGDAWFFGGDTHFGRHIARAIADPGRAEILRRPILSVTGKRPLVVNLEGVLLDQEPGAYRHPMRIGMRADTAIEELKQLHVAAVGIENNHSLDYGRQARERMISLLESAGITVVHGPGPVTLGPFRIAAATDLANLPVPAKDLIDGASFDAWRQPAARTPLFAFVHCGREYHGGPGARERQLADWAENAGASLFLGCHPHRPSPGWERTAKSLRFFSMGNLIFDQPDPQNTGGLVEVRFFEQGTWAARWIPLGNLYLESMGNARPSATEN
jgi:AmmeMemoRadiSam system protein B